MSNGERKVSQQGDVWYQTGGSALNFYLEKQGYNPINTRTYQRFLLETDDRVACSPKFLIPFFFFFFGSEGVSQFGSCRLTLAGWGLLFGFCSLGLAVWDSLFEV